MLLLTVIMTDAEMITIGLSCMKHKDMSGDKIQY